MQPTAQYLAIFAALLSLSIAATMAVLRNRSAPSLFYASAAWIALVAMIGLAIEPHLFASTAPLPNGGIAIEFYTTIHSGLTWGVLTSCLLAVLGSIGVVLGYWRRQPNSEETTVSSRDSE